MHSVTVYKIRRVALAALYAMIFWLAGCKDPLETTLPNAGSNAAQQKSYLTFKSFDEFNKTIDKLAQQSPAQRQASVSSQGFISLRTLFDKAIAEEAANYEREEKLYLDNPKAVIVHERSATALLLADMVIYDSQYGGIVLNLPNPKMADVLNKDGIVAIGNGLYRFTYDAVKSAPRIDDESRTIGLLKATTKTDKSNNVSVNTVSHSIKLLPSSNARYNNRSCEGVRADGSGYLKWRMIAYIDESASTGYELDYNSYNQNTGAYNISSVWSWASVSIMVRTLERGAFGYWYDRDSTLQKLVGDFTLTGGSSTPSGTNITALASPIDREPGSTLTSSWYTQLYSATYQYSAPSWWQYANINSNNPPSGTVIIPPSIASNSMFNFFWRGDYNCNCDIGY